MRKKFFWIVVTICCFTLFFACENKTGEKGNDEDKNDVVDDDKNDVVDDDKNDVVDDDQVHAVTYSGMAMKGPFYPGGNVTVFACDENGIQTGKAYTSHIENATGNFTLDAEVNGTVIVKAEGPYFNEIYNESSTGTVRVEAVFNATGAGTQNAFLNPISHIISYCKLKKIQSGENDELAEIACADLLFGELALPKPDPFTVETLRDIQYPYPIAFSCGITQAAKLIAQADKSKFDTELQRILDQAKIELATGALSSGTKIIFRNGFATLDAEVCRSNLQTYLDSETEGIIIPPLGEALDTDGDGIPDSIDPDIDGDGIPNELDCVVGKTDYKFVLVLRDVVCASKEDNSWECSFVNFTPVTGVGNENWDKNFNKVVSGKLHFCAIDSIQNLYCWQHIGLGIYQESPLKISNETWKDIFSGQQRFCALSDNDKLYCWENDLTALGMQINNDTDWQNMSLGNDKFYAIKTDGTLWGWDFGENPEQIGTDLWKFISNTSLYAIKTDGTLWYISDFMIPVQIGEDTDWEEVYGTCAIKTDHSLWCWNETDNTPFTNTDNTGWSCGRWGSISHYKGSYELYCGIKSDNSLWCLINGKLLHIQELP
jgi:hypothetical protein